MNISMVDLIEKKRRGDDLTEAEIRWMIQSYTAGEVPDYQMSAFAMAVCFQGMTETETAVLTDAMARSGELLDLSGFATPAVDKHSTGGVGDKCTLIVAPLAAAMGCTVAKMSGRGLGHTGGTVDKLESIAGFRTELTREEFFRQAHEVGIVVAGQSANLAPADKRLYALRDVTGTVSSIPLITSSIMSKKLAAGAPTIVLDVKVGSGAFASTLAYGEELARGMIAIGRACGRNVAAVLSNMDRPLGRYIGNALEVREALAVLKGEDVPDLRELCLALASLMVSLGQDIPLPEARRRAEQTLESGAALAKFRQWIAAQGGDPRVAEDPDLMGKAPVVRELAAPFSGFLTGMDTQAVGKAAAALGAGREKAGESIDHTAGIVLLKKPGEAVRAGETAALLYSSTEERAQAGLERLAAACRWDDDPPEPQPLIYQVLH